MPKFFFDTKLDDITFQDPDGADFGSAEEAAQQAIEDAAAYAGDRIAHGRELDDEVKIVRSEAGEIIAQFTLREALERMSRNG